MPDTPTPIRQRPVAGPPGLSPARQKAPFNFQQLDAMDQFQNILFYGEGSSGKTTALAHMAHSGRILIVNAEGGAKQLPLRKLGVPVENIAVFPNPSDPSQELTYEALEQLYWQIKGDLVDDPTSWAGTGWDSVTEIVQKLIENAVKIAYDRAVMKGNPADRQRFQRQLDDYGTMTEQVRLLVRRFRDLPCNFAVTALERREQDNDGKVVYQPAVTPALQNDLYGYMDVVVHTTMKEVGGEELYFGQTRPGGKYRGKDRYHQLPSRMVSPTFDRCVAYIKGELTVENDELVEQYRAISRRAESTPEVEA